MYGPKGNSSVGFPEGPDVSRDEVQGNIRTRGKTNLTSFPIDHALSVLLYIWTFIWKKKLENDLFKAQITFSSYFYINR